MFICVNNLAKGSSENVKFSTELYLENIKLLSPNVQVDVEGTLTNEGERYIFDAKANAHLKTQCYSCLTSIYLPLSFEINEVYSKIQFHDEDLLIFSSKDNIINFTEAIRRNIVLNLPMKLACSDECKGLCHLCGADLNLEECTCKKEYINPKFEKILQLFNEKNKEA